MGPKAAPPAAPAQPPATKRRVFGVCIGLNRLLGEPADGENHGGIVGSQGYYYGVSSHLHEMCQQARKEIGNEALSMFNKFAFGNEPGSCQADWRVVQIPFVPGFVDDTLPKLRVYELGAGSQTRTLRRLQEHWRSGLWASLQSVHLQSPMVIGEDIHRAEQHAPLVPGVTRCYHTVCDCTCYEANLGNTTHMALYAEHSAYYFRAADWLRLSVVQVRLMGRGIESGIWATLHKFPLHLERGTIPHGAKKGEQEFDWWRVPSEEFPGWYDVIQEPTHDCGSTYRSLDPTPLMCGKPVRLSAEVVIIGTELLSTVGNPKHGDTTLEVLYKVNVVTLNMIAALSRQAVNQTGDELARTVAKMECYARVFDEAIAPQHFVPPPPPVMRVLPPVPQFGEEIPVLTDTERNLTCAVLSTHTLQPDAMANALVIRACNESQRVQGNPHVFLQQMLELGARTGSIISQQLGGVVEVYHQTGAATSDRKAMSGIWGEMYAHVPARLRRAFLVLLRSVRFGGGSFILGDAVVARIVSCLALLGWGATVAYTSLSRFLRKLEAHLPDCVLVVFGSFGLLVLSVRSAIVILFNSMRALVCKVRKEILPSVSGKLVGQVDRYGHVSDDWLRQYFQELIIDTPDDQPCLTYVAPGSQGVATLTVRCLNPKVFNVTEEKDRNGRREWCIPVAHPEATLRCTSAEYCTCWCEGKPGATLQGLVCGVVSITRDCPRVILSAFVDRHLIGSVNIVPEGATVESLYDLALLWWNLQEGKFAMAYGQYLNDEAHDLAATGVKRLLQALSRSTQTLQPGATMSFPKVEKSNFSDKGRLISAHANAVTAQHLKAKFLAIQYAQKQVMDGSLARINGVRVGILASSGKNAFELGAEFAAILAIGVLLYYERDFKRFDSSNQWIHLLLKCRCWRKAVGPEMVQWLTQLANTTRGRCTVKRDKIESLTYKFAVRGTVKSGHNDTSSGNTQVNAMATVEAVVRARIHSITFIVGDDALVCCLEKTTQEQIDTMMKVERSVGHMPEGRSFAEPWQVTFASGRFYPLKDGGWVFGPLIGRLLTRLWWSKSSMSEKQRQRWLKTVAMGLKGVCGGLPVLGSLVGPAADLRVNQLDEVERERLCDADQGHFKTGDQVAHYGPEIWGYVAKIYGVSEDDLRVADKLVRAYALVPCLLKHRVLEVIVAHDLADLMDRPALPVPPPSVVHVPRPQVPAVRQLTPQQIEDDRRNALLIKPGLTWAERFEREQGAMMREAADNWDGPWPAWDAVLEAETGLPL